MSNEATDVLLIEAGILYTVNGLDSPFAMNEKVNHIVTCSSITVNLVNAVLGGQFTSDGAKYNFGYAGAFLIYWK